MITPGKCSGEFINDIDYDGFSDDCEEWLAVAFSPQLYYYSYDLVGREPHWVARPVGARVRLGYLLSYYRDEGSSAWVCGPGTILPGTSSCNGHNGDSEFIILDVSYNSTTMHWVLNTAFLSQHGSAVSYDRGTNAYPTQFYYPQRLGGYPRVWVSEGKHANYSSRSECNAGGFLNVDTCVDNNTSAQVESAYFLNIGSRIGHTNAQDCMTSSNPNYIYYGSGRVECYWTEKRFRGWIPTTVGGADSDPYSPILASMGY